MCCLCEVIANVNKGILANHGSKLLLAKCKMLHFCRRRASSIVGFADLTDAVSSSSSRSLVYRMYRAAHCHYLIISRSLSMELVQSNSIYLPHRKYGSWLPGLCTGRCGLESGQGGGLYNIAHFAKLQTLFRPRTTQASEQQFFQQSPSPTSAHSIQRSTSE